MPFPAFLDACVLIPARLSDLLLRLADAGTYRPLWSEGVLDEVERNLPKLGVSAGKARRRVDAMRTHFVDAMVGGHEGLIEAMCNHKKDRHVLAAAVRANAEIIVTANVRDFPPAALGPYEITAVKPDDFLLDQLDLYPGQTIGCLMDMITDYHRPPITAESLLQGLVGTAPRFAAEARTPLLQAVWVNTDRRNR